MSRWFLYDKNYGAIFRALQIIPSGHNVPLLQTTADKPTPYRIFFNVHKPVTPYRKTAPCLPDYQIVVINARTTPMPTLRELTDLFDVSPELPAPLPRQRRPPNNAPPNVTSALSPQSVSWPRRIFYWFRPSPGNTMPTRRPHPFMAMKAGKKTVIVAVVDAGSIGFFRFGQGAFDEWPLA